MSHHPLFSRSRPLLVLSLSAGCFVAGPSAKAEDGRKKRGEKVEEAAAKMAEDAGPASSASQIPALAKLLEQAEWTPTPELSGVFQAGMIFEVTTLGHRPLANGCVMAKPMENTYTSTEMVTSLQAGVSVGGVMASAGMSGGIIKKVKFGTPVQVSIPSLDLELTDVCKAKLKSQPAAKLATAYVVQEVLRAEIAEQTCGRIDASGRMVGLGAADAEFAAACQQASLEPVAVGYRTVPLSQLLGMGALVAPTPTTGPTTTGGGTPDGSGVDATGVLAEINAAKALEARLELELSTCLAQEATKRKTAAFGEWTRGGLAELEKMTDAVAKSKGKAPMEAFIAKYGSGVVECHNDLGARTQPVVVPEVARARAWLSAPAMQTSVAAVDTVPTAGNWTGKLGYEMVAVPAGTYVLGCTAGQSGCQGDETQHTVKLSRAYYIGRTEVTQGLYQTVIGSNPSKYPSCGTTCPVEQVSWVDAAKFANALSAKEGLQQCYGITGDSVTWTTGLACTGYRLPTEAEWEVAARGGRDTMYSGGTDLGAVAWYDGNSGDVSHPVAQKLPNGYGLYDMSGNVWEWVWDGYGPYAASTTDPLGAEQSRTRLRRGGSLYTNPSWTRLSLRSGILPSDRDRFQGIRLARTIP